MQRRIAHLVERATAPVKDGGYDYTTSLTSTLLGHAGLRPDEGKVIYWSTPEQVAEELAAYQPHLVVLWEQRGVMLRTFSGGHHKSVDDLAGYVWEASAVCSGVRCMATYAPARLTKEWALTGVMRFHLNKAAMQAAGVASGRPVGVPTRNIEVALPSRGYTAQDVVNGLGLLRTKKQPLALDIEGGTGMGPSCIGFAYSAHDAFVVPFYDVDGVSIWNENDEVAIVTAVVELLEDGEVPKIIQNSLYELFVLAWTWGAVVRGLRDDTMVKHFELYAELEKSLEFQACIYTNQPYWKLEHRQVEGRYVPFRNGKRVTSEEWYLYNGTDCCVTYEVNEVMERMLKPKQREHYQFNMSLLVPVAYMSLRGIRYDKQRAKARLAEVQEQIYELQDEINLEAAKSSERVELHQFFQALGVVASASGRDVKDVEPTVSGLSGAESEIVSNTVDRQQRALDQHRTDRMDSGSLAALLPLLTTAFCCCARDRAEKREVEEVSWQPLKLNPKGRWVRDGKRIDQIDQTCTGEGQTWFEKEGIVYCGNKAWQKHIKTVTRRLPVAVETLEVVRRFTLASKEAECKQACRLASEADKGTGLSAAQRGELATLLGIEVKINSTAQGGDAQWFLYEHCGLPKQFAKDGNKLTTKLASDDEAIIKAYLKSGKDEASRDNRALLFLKMRRLVTQTKFLVAEPDPDGRIRSGMNLVATPTCRMAMYGSPTGASDLNLQTIGKGLRDLFVADEGCLLGQRDLAGADGWTVAAFCAMLGDTNMLEDYRAKLKPAQILTVMQDRGAVVNRMTREELRPLCKVITEETDWRYFANKRRQHGRSYGMGKITTSDQILTDSFKLLGRPIYVSPADCETFFTTCFDVRYPGVMRVHAWMKRELQERGVLVASTGFQRRVFGRKDDHSTLKELLAHFPQYFTTFSIKNTLVSMEGRPRQWTDPENRREDGSLRVEPLLMVHDSNVSQWREKDTAFAKVKLTEWFDNPIQVAGLTLTIPASGTYGPDWKHQDQSL